MKKIFLILIALFLLPVFLFAQQINSDKNTTDSKLTISQINVIENGDFSNGNNSFYSSYYYTSTNTTEGEYYVGKDASRWYPDHYSCGDHTSGKGKMLLVNGSPEENRIIWKTTSKIYPGRKYRFTFWITSISAPNPAVMALVINGKEVSRFKSSGKPCTWASNSVAWLPDGSGSATIALINKNTIRHGNDFALDDLSFIETTEIITPDCSEKVTAGFSPAVSENNVLALSLKEPSLKSLKTVHWSVNDSIHTEELSPAFSGLTPGTYSVKAKTISLNGCIDSTVQSVTIVKKVMPVQASLSPGSILPGYDTRKMEISKSFDIKEDSVRVFLSDNGIVDGDSITLVYDGKIILTHYLLKAKPLELKLAVSKDRPVHELIMYAENLGSIPPNTSLMKVIDGSKKHEVYIRASENSNAVVKFRRTP